MRRTLLFIWLSFYAFLLFFEPPILPVGQVYITGVLTVGLLAATPARRHFDDVMRLAGGGKVLVALILMSAYLLTVSSIDAVFVDQSNWSSTRLKTFNQLFVLTSIQVLGVLYILCEVRRHGLGLEDIMKVALGAAFIECLCVLAALALPTVRDLFLRYAASVYSNAWLLERRGYGFSATLLDTFGYGVGLLCGIALLVPSGKKPLRAACLVLLVVAALYNSRTGLLVILVAVAFKLLFGKSRRDILKGILVLSALVALLFSTVPALIDIGSHSDSLTIKWATSALKDFYALYSGDSDIGDMQFISDIVALPSSLFELVFGSGHIVYGSEAAAAGVRTDIGYTNIFWAYGIIGSAAYYAFMIHAFWKAYSLSPTYEHKSLVLFLAVAFFLVQVKGNVLGASPGICVTYCVLLSLVYFGNCRKVPEVAGDLVLGERLARGGTIG